jgi:monoamine oxidase
MFRSRDERGNFLQTMKRFSRRSFLGSAAALAASPALGAIPASGDVDVAIIGAGAAGIAAARRVAGLGRRFALIEAGERVGGRCITDTRTFGVPYDRGAHWIHFSDINPLMKLPGKSGLETYSAPPGQRIRIGQRNAREGELENFLAALVRSTRTIGDAARGKADVSAAQALPKNLADWQSTIEFMLGPYGCSKDLAEISAMDFAKAVERDSESLCRQGYGALLARAAQGMPVQLSTPVTRVEWGKGLEIETARGRITPRAIIFTVSTNVLASGKIKFSPDLPRRQLDAATKLKLGTYERVALELPGNPLGLRQDDLVFEKSENSRTAAMVANVSGTSLCHVDVGGRFGRELSAQGEQAMVAFALEWLSGLYGADVKKAVKRTHATQWDKEPWVLGATAVASPGVASARRVLMEPLRDRVWFAGEAVHETLWGTVNGAWESGERAAEAALRKLGFLKTAPEARAPARRRS